MIFLQKCVYISSPKDIEYILKTKFNCFEKGNIQYNIFKDLKPDALFVLGDTNSSLCEISAKRLKIPIFHYRHQIQTTIYVHKFLRHIQKQCYRLALLEVLYNLLLKFFRPHL